MSTTKREPSAAATVTRKPWRDAFALDFPTKLQLQTINRCNYACTMCPYPETEKTRGKTVMSEALLERILAELEERQRNVKLCIMLQNEPLLDPRFVDLARRAHASDRIDAIATVTNGSMLTTALLDELTALPRFALTISVNATTPGRYLHVHGRDRWDQVTSVLTSWHGPRNRVVLSCVVPADEMELGAAFEARWQPLGYRVRLVPLNGRKGTRDGDERLHRESDASGHCHYPIDTLTVRADGKVLLCCQDWQHEQVYGDLARDSIHDIWNGPALTSVRQASLAGRIGGMPQCAGCDYPLRSARRAALEQRLGAVVQPTAVAGASVMHRSFLRLADGARVPVAVRQIDAGGTAQVVAMEPLSAPVEEMEAQLAREHGFTSAIGCRATATRLPLAADGGVTAWNVTIDHDDPRAAFWRWYHDDWRAD